MSWKTRCAWLPLMAVAAVVVVTNPAFAASTPLTLQFGSTDTTPNTQPPFTNPGPPPTDTSFFTGQFDLGNGSQLTVGANINFNFHISANLGVTGASISPTGNLNFPTSTQGISLQGGPLVVNSTPSGSATLTLANPLPSVLTNASITSLNTTLVSSGPTATTTPVSLNGSGSIDLGSVFGLFDVTIPVGANFTGNGAAGINSISYNQTFGNMLVDPGTGPVSPSNQSTTYLMNLGNLLPGGTNPGNLNASVNAGVNGNMALSIFGLNIANVPLNLAQNLPISSSFPLPGVANLTDLNPGGYNTVHHDDLQATMGLSTSGFNLSFPVDTAGNTTVTFGTTIATNVGVAVTVSVTATATLTFGILGTLNAANIGYQLQDSIAGVVVPEPGSIALLFIGVAAALPFVIRRARRR